MVAPAALSAEQMQAGLKELEQALYSHEQWTEVLRTTLICRLHPDERDLVADADHRCRFGQWCDSTGSEVFGAHPSFVEITRQHHRMHQFAAHLLQSSTADEPIALQDYEQFVSVMKSMRLEIATLEQELRVALHSLDALTGIPGRVGMLTKLRETQKLVARKVFESAIAIADLDHFKSVNDEFGHLIGDKVLIAFAKYLTEHIRPYDVAFRYGGEEFLICLPDTNLATARAVIERLREGFGAVPHEIAQNRSVHVTASFGIAPLDGAASVEQCIERADAALYKVKEAGRNQTVVWEPSDVAEQAPPG